MTKVNGAFLKLKHDFTFRFVWSTFVCLHLTLYFMIMPFDVFEIHVSCISNIMENVAFAPKEQMLHFP